MLKMESYNWLFLKQSIKLWHKNKEIRYETRDLKKNNWYEIMEIEWNWSSEIILFLKMSKR